MNITKLNNFNSEYYTDRRYIKLRSMEWFEENAYNDDSGYWWVNKDEFSEWKQEKSYIPAMTEEDVTNGLSMWAIQYQNDFESYCWGMEREITVETDPEYFI